MMLKIIKYFYPGLTILFFTLFTCLSTPAFAEEDNVLNVAGWDIYGDPEYVFKTIGFEDFEKRQVFKLNLNS